MQIQKSTIDVLSHFASLNPGIAIKPGNTVSTISLEQNIFTKAELDDVFPKACNLYEIKTLLSTISQFPSPTLKFTEDKVVVSGTNSKERCSFFYSSPAMITVFDEGDGIQMPANRPDENEYAVEFNMSNEHFQRVLKMSSTLGLQYVLFKTDEEGNISLSVLDPKNPQSNEYVLEGLEYTHTNPNVQCIFNVDTLRLFPGDYKVIISTAPMGYFENITFPIKYWTTAEDISILGRD